VFHPKREYKPQNDVKEVKINITATSNATTFNVDGNKSTNDPINKTDAIAMRIKRSVFPMFFFMNQMYVSSWFL
jgi:hypothetical protein